MEFIPPRQRYRLFFDETGNGDLHAAEKSPNERYLSVTGIVIRQDSHDGYVTRRLNHLKRTIFGLSEKESLVLHRREIMRKEGKFSTLRNASLRAEFDARALAMIAECIATAFTVSMDKAEHKERYKVWQYSPYHYVTEMLVERFVKWLDKNDFVGDVIGEARNPTHDKKLRRAYQAIYRHGNNFVSAQTFQARLTSSALRLVPKGQDIAGLQLADLLAHPAHRALKFAQLGEPMPEDYGALLAEVLLRSVYDRSSGGRIEGFGRKWLP